MARQATDTWMRPPALEERMSPGQSWPGLRHSRLGAGVWSKDSPAAATVVFRVQSGQFFLGEEKSGGLWIR